MKVQIGITELHPMFVLNNTHVRIEKEVEMSVQVYKRYRKIFKDFQHAQQRLAKILDLKEIL